MREKKLLLRSLTLLLPLFGAGLLHCTFSGLDSLGAGGSDGGLPDDSGLIAPTPDTGTVDTGTHPQTDSGGQPPVDSGPTPVVDSGEDAGVDASETVPPAANPIFVDAGTSTWCTQHPQYTLFCADFDEVPLPAGFGSSDGAFLAQTSSIASSSPNDLLLFVPIQTSGPWGSKLSRQFSTQAQSIVLAFDFDPELVLTNSGILFAGLDLVGNSNAKYSLRLAYNNGAPRLEESYLSSTPDRYHANFTLPLRTWSRIQVEITFPPYSSSSTDAGAGADAGVSTESIYVNGVLQGAPETLLPPTGFDQRPDLLLGAVYGASLTTAAWAFRYDNVTIDIQ